MKTKYYQIIIIFSSLLLFNSCSVKTKEKKSFEINQITEDYKIHQIEIEYIPDYKFNYPTFNYFLDFITSPSKKHNYKGSVKSVSHYHKFANKLYKDFDRQFIYNREGYEIEYNHNSGRYKNFYDDENNLIRQLNISEADTVHDYTFTYNNKHQIISFNQRHPRKESKQYDSSINITYNIEGNPVLLKRDNYNKKEYSFEKTIEYKGNIVTISKIKNNKKVIEEVLVYSSKKQLLKHQKGGSTLFEFYNKKGLVKKRMVFDMNQYKRTMIFTYDKNGNVIKKITSNHLEKYNKITNIKYKLDSIGNVTYEHFSYNYREDAFEKFYDFEYFD